MSGMMGRFSLSGNQKGAATSPAATPSHTGSSLNISKLASKSISSVSSSVTNISSLTKKMGAGINMAHLTGTDPDKKAKLEAEEKKNQIALALSTLEDVRLQSPQTHTGLVLAYTGTTLSPIINPGIKFTWFRMSGEDTIVQLEESLRAWYPPTVDDIGTIICAQCEDNFDQGCSRYVECGPIKADALLCSLAESTVEYGIFEAKEICVSLGMEVQESSVDDYATLMQNHVNNTSTNLLRNLTTVLSKDSAFLQLNGHSTIEVDESGIFISIPTFTKSTSEGTGGGAAATAAAGAAASRSNKNDKGLKARRGLRIPASTGLRVECAQPLSLILTVPIMHKGMPESAGSESAPNSPAKAASATATSTATPTASGKHSAADSDDDDEDGDADTTAADKTTESDSTKLLDSPSNAVAAAGTSAEEAEDEKMKRFLSSSIVAIPWTYEGHHHSPESYAEELVGSQLTAEEKEQLIKTAEEEAIIFANTVCALAEFISSLPEGTSELKLCFSCTDRLVRDALTLGIRSLAAQPSGCTRYERRRVFPWLSAEEADGAALGGGRGDALGTEGVNSVSSALVGESNESDQDIKRRLRSVEEENAALKRERNELSMKLLESREEVVQLKNIQQGGRSLHGGGSSYNLREDGNGAAGESVDGSVDGLSAADLEGDKLEQFKQLSSKVIELENKLSVINKRESEAAKIRADIEARNNRLITDVEKYKKTADEATRKLASVQALYDRQMSAIQRLEDDQVKTKNEIDQYELKLREMNALKATLEAKNTEILEWKKQLQESEAEIKAGKVQLNSLKNHIESLTSESNARAKEYESSIAQLQNKLELSDSENKKLQGELNAKNERIVAVESELTEAKKLETELKEARARGDRLNGELNHMQQKLESQTREMKKTMKDNAMSLAEFEKALVRKSEECNDLYFKINAMKDAETARLASESSTTAGSIFSKLSALRRDSMGGTVAVASGGSTHDGSPGSGSNDAGSSTAAAATTGSETSNSSSSVGLIGMFRKNSVA